MIISGKTTKDINEIKRELKQINQLESITLENLDIKDVSLNDYIYINDCKNIKIKHSKINEITINNTEDITIRDSEIKEFVALKTNRIFLENTHIKRLYLDNCILYDLYKFNNSAIDKIIINNVLYLGNEADKLFENSEVEFEQHGYSNLHSIVPKEGSFIGYKKVRDIDREDVIVKLLIPEDAKRSSGSTRKCRASKVKVLDMYYMDDKNKKCKEAYNAFYRICEDCGNDCMKCELTETQIFKLGTMYKIGEIIEANGFDENRWNVCTQGIHFFLTEEEAINYEI